MDTVSIQIDLPKKLVNRINDLAAKGFYKNKNDFFVDASINWIEQIQSESKIKEVTHLYLIGKLKKSKNKYENIRKVFSESIEEDTLKTELDIKNVDELMDKLRGRIE
ncbi:MAG: hypothetical protein ACE5KT_11930 [Methanosarcinales archaeon]